MLNKHRIEERKKARINKINKRLIKEAEEDRKRKIINKHKKIDSKKIKKIIDRLPDIKMVLSEDGEEYGCETEEEYYERM